MRFFHNSGYDSRFRVFCRLGGYLIVHEPSFAYQSVMVMQQYLVIRFICLASVISKQQTSGDTTNWVHALQIIGPSLHDQIRNGCPLAWYVAGWLKYATVLGLEMFEIHGIIRMLWIYQFSILVGVLKIVYKTSLIFRRIKT